MTTVIRALWLLLAWAALWSVSRAQTALEQPWLGQIEARLSIATGGYEREEVQTWKFVGGPTRLEGGFTIHDAVWTVSGKGTTARTQGAQQVTTNWTVEVGPTPVKLATIIRASDKKLIVHQWGQRAQLARAVSGVRRVNANGKAQPEVPVSGAAYEWSFPSIEAAGMGTTLTGSATFTVEAMAADFVPSVTPVPKNTATASWNLQRYAASVPANATPTARNPTPSATPRLSATKAPTVAPTSVPSARPTATPVNGASASSPSAYSGDWILVYALPANFFGSSDVSSPTVFTARQSRVSIQVYPFRAFTGDIVPAFQSGMQWSWIDPRFREKSLAGSPEHFQINVAGATSAYAARFHENVGGVLNERMRMMIIAQQQVAFVDLIADRYESWLQLKPELERFVDSIRVVRRGDVAGSPTNTSPIASPTITEGVTSVTPTPTPTPNDPPAGTSRIEGVFLTKTSGNVRPGILLFGGDGRFAGEGLNKLAGNSSAPAFVRGTYQIRGTTLAITAEDRSVLQYSLQSEGTDPLSPQRLLLNGTVFEREKDPPDPLPARSTP